MTREDRVKIAQETVAISKRGTYLFNGVEKQLTQENNYLLWEPFDMNGMCVDSIEYEGKYNGDIIIRNESVVDTVYSLQSRKINGDKVGVLNFASAKHPGGGFLNGSMAQEEALAYCSNLYEVIRDSDFYKINARSKSTAYTDTTITSRITFFRTADFCLVNDPYDVNIITCPAVNMSGIKLSKIDEAKQIMTNRMAKVIALMINRNYEYIVLGAYGCGVFKNDPKDVASVWYNLLVERGLRFYFHKIYFTIIETSTDQNMKAFKQIFNN